VLVVLINQGTRSSREGKGEEQGGVRNPNNDANDGDGDDDSSCRVGYDGNGNSNANSNGVSDVVTDHVDDNDGHDGDNNDEPDASHCGLMRGDQWPCERR